MTELLDLCYDVLIRILEEVDPPDLAACAQTSVGFAEFIKKNTRLYKAHYLKTFVRRMELIRFLESDGLAGRSSTEAHRSGAGLGARVAERHQMQEDTRVGQQ